MRWMMVLLCIFGVMLAFLCWAHAQAPATDKSDAVKAPTVQTTQLWGGISTNEPIYREGDTGKLNLVFTVYNEGDKTLDPKINEATLVINGQDYPGSMMLFGNGPRDNRFSALPPGDYLLFNYGLGDLFAKSGLYRVYWKTPVLQSAEIEIRVLPKLEKIK